MLRLRVVIGRESGPGSPPAATGGAVPDLGLAAGEWDVALLGGLPAGEVTRRAAELRAEHRDLPARSGLTLLSHALADLVPGSRRGRHELTSGILACSDRIIEDRGQRLPGGGWAQVARLACGLTVGHAHLPDGLDPARAEIAQQAFDCASGSALLLATDFELGASDDPRADDLEGGAEQSGIRLLHTGELRVHSVQTSESGAGARLEVCVELTGGLPG